MSFPHLDCPSSKHQRPLNKNPNTRYEKPLLSYWPGLSKGFLKYAAIPIAFNYSQEVEGKSLLQKTPHTSETRVQSYLSWN